MSEQFDPYHRWLGISPKDQPPNHYRLLGIDLFEPDPEVIRDAAEQRIAHVRTYQLGRHMAVSQQILNELGAAKACLLDAVRKAAYDATLRESIAPAAPAPPAPAPPAPAPPEPAPPEPAPPEPVVPPPKPEPTPPQTTSSADELASPPIEVQPWLPLPPLRRPARWWREKRARFILVAVGAACLIVLALLFVGRGSKEPRPAAGLQQQPSPAEAAGTPAGKSPLSQEINVDLGSGATMGLVLIPAGSFLMGDESNGPVHKVNLTKPFYLGKYEVTQEQWLAVMDNNPSTFKAARNPVENVSWNDCQAFFAKLNAKRASEDGKFSLPTEAQWEYACRAGSTTKYCFGDGDSQLREYAWHSGKRKGKAHPVGQKKPNSWGLHDMHGNVWEWCADWSSGDYYGKSPPDDPTGPAAGLLRVNRGGCFARAADFCRSAGRGGLPPQFRNKHLGFRAALAPAE